MQVVRGSVGKDGDQEHEPVSVIVWLPDSEESLKESTNLLRRLRDAGLRVFAASSPDQATTNLFVGDSVYSGE